MHAERCRYSEGAILLLCEERLRRKHHFRLVTCCGLIRKRLILKAEWLLWVYTVCGIHVKFREDRSAGSDDERGRRDVP